VLEIMASGFMNGFILVVFLYPCDHDLFFYLSKLDLHLLVGQFIHPLSALPQERVGSKVVVLCG
jgi:hypothetical protein